MSFGAGRVPNTLPKQVSTLLVFERHSDTHKTSLNCYSYFIMKGYMTHVKEPLLDCKLVLVRELVQNDGCGQSCRVVIMLVLVGLLRG